MSVHLASVARLLVALGVRVSGAFLTYFSSCDRFRCLGSPIVIAIAETPLLFPRNAAMSNLGAMAGVSAAVAPGDKKTGRKSLVARIAAEAQVSQVVVRKFLMALRRIARQQLRHRAVFQIRGILTLRVKTRPVRSARGLEKTVVATAAGGHAFYDLNVNGCWREEVSRFYSRVAKMNGYGIYSDPRVAKVKAKVL